MLSLSAHRVSRTSLSGKQTWVELLRIVLVAPHTLDVELGSRPLTDVTETPATLDELPPCDDTAPTLTSSFPLVNVSPSFSITP